MTRIQQNYDQYQQDQEHQEQHDYNNYNYYIPHGAGRVPEKLLPSDMEKIREAYVDNIGDLTGAVARMIETALHSGLTADEVVMAIEETGFAPRPSAWYLKKVLENWAEDGVTVSKYRHKIRANKAKKWWR